MNQLNDTDNTELNPKLPPNPGLQSHSGGQTIVQYHKRHCSILYFQCHNMYLWKKETLPVASTLCSIQFHGFYIRPSFVSYQSYTVFLTEKKERCRNRNLSGCLLALLSFFDGLHVFNIVLLLPLRRGPRVFTGSCWLLLMGADQRPAFWLRATQHHLLCVRKSLHRVESKLTEQTNLHAPKWLLVELDRA